MSQEEQDRDAVIAAQREENAALREENKLLQQKVDYLIRQLYGSKSDKTDPGQLELLLNPEDAKKPDAAGCDQNAPAAEPVKHAGAAKKERNNRLRASMASLPVDEETIEPEEVKAAPENFRRIGREVSERLEVSPARYWVKRTVRPVYVRRGEHADDAPLTAPLPSALLEGSVLSASLAADLLTRKFVYHQPFNRQQWEIKATTGIDLSRKLMCHWHDKLAGLLEPLYKLIAADLRVADYLQIDETPIKYLAPGTGKTSTGYLWVYHHPKHGVLYDWHSSREASCLDRVLIDKANGHHFRGVLQCDGYSAYLAWIRGKSGIRRAACLAHIRRKFIEAQDDHPHITAWILRLIGNLYQIEKQARRQKLAPALRKAVRASQSAMTIKLLARAIERLSRRASILPKSKLGRALAYARGQWAAAGVWIDHGRIEVDNNQVENAVRPTKLGMKNCPRSSDHASQRFARCDWSLSLPPRWMFIGSEDAGQRSAIVYTLVENIRRHGGDPRAYLQWVFERLPSMTNQDDLRELLPNAWLAAGKVAAA